MAHLAGGVLGGDDDATSPFRESFEHGARITTMSSPYQLTGWRGVTPRGRVVTTG
jgi:hypothetical protein